MLTLHNGRELAEATISILDPIVVRGDGCFEAARCYDGVPFRLDAHLARLARSAERMSVPLPPLNSVREWSMRVAAERGDGVLRILASNHPDGPSVHVFSTALPPMPEGFRLHPVFAPWHPAGEPWGLAGVKTLSYAPNMDATRTAEAAGADEALLIGRGDVVLEGPTWSVLWVVDGRIETPSLDLGILASVTRAVIVDAASVVGTELTEGHFPLSRLASATEVAIMSTTKEIAPVIAVGDDRFAEGPVTKALSAVYADEVAREQEQAA